MEDSEYIRICELIRTHRTDWKGAIDQVIEYVMDGYSTRQDRVALLASNKEICKILDNWGLIVNDIYHKFFLIKSQVYSTRYT